MLLALALLSATTAPSLPGKTAPRTPAQQPISAPDLPDSAWARDVCFPDARTIVIADWDGLSHTSKDGGATWTSADMGAVVRSLAIDERGVLWGLYRWHGIHEPSTASLVWSDDLGSSWHELVLDPRVCMPESFVAGWTELTLLAADGQLWRHLPAEPESFDNWSKLGQPNPDASGACGERWSEEALLVSSGTSVFTSSDRGESWQLLHREGVVDFLLPLEEQRGQGSIRHEALTRTGKLITLDARLESRAGAQRWHFSGARVTRELAESSIVFHAIRARDHFVLCGETRGAAALGLLVGAKTERELPGLAGNQTVQVRAGFDGPWIVGKGVYRLSKEQDRWELVWPKR